MRIYFDTNVYRFIQERGQADHVRQYLNDNRHAVYASWEVISESAAIKDSEYRADAIRTIATVARRYERFPVTYYHANELVSEVRRLRSDWPITSGDPAIHRQLEAAFRRVWTLARNSPNTLREDIGIFIAEGREEMKAERRVQQAVREAYLSGAMREAMVSDNPQLRSERDIVGALLEFFWRYQGEISWKGMFCDRPPQENWSAVYLLPYLDMSTSVHELDHREFWWRGVDGDSMPHARLTGQAYYFQLKRKTQASDALDRTHASQLLHCDLFVTADYHFFDVLNQVSLLNAGCGLPVLVRRTAPDATEEISLAIEMSLPAVRRI